MSLTTCNRRNAICICSATKRVGTLTKLMVVWSGEVLDQWKLPQLFTLFLRSSPAAWSICRRRRRQRWSIPRNRPRVYEGFYGYHRLQKLGHHPAFHSPVFEFCLQCLGLAIFACSASTDAFRISSLPLSFCPSGASLSFPSDSTETGRRRLLGSWTGPWVHGSEGSDRFRWLSWGGLHSSA